ncbi:hypothetical protein C0995_006919 [Termitomyces sp. Mi166|nr:hypothetical protein C0995_006919 [Termitomyces sp. Mi166\
MGIAVLSGVIDSLDITSKFAKTNQLKWESHTPGTLTPTGPPDATVPSRYIACVSRAETVLKLQRIFGGLGAVGSGIEVVTGQNVPSVQRADVVLLCCKPQMAQTILEESGMKEALEGKLLISILAGVTIRQLQGWVLPSTKVIRAMPNTPCKIREGMTVISTLPPSPDVETDRTIILKIFSSIGRCRFLEEKHFDACTALSGSGPAFACIFMEAMADGGVMMGLPRAEALELAAQSKNSFPFTIDLSSSLLFKSVRSLSNTLFEALQGAARMVLQGSTHPAQLKDAVTTPGGCTIAGLLAMEDGRVRSTIARAIQVATDHASQLGQPKQ